MRYHPFAAIGCGVGAGDGTIAGPVNGYRAGCGRKGPASLGRGDGPGGGFSRCAADRDAYGLFFREVNFRRRGDVPDDNGLRGILLLILNIRNTGAQEKRNACDEQRSNDAQPWSPMKVHDHDHPSSLEHFEGTDLT